MFIKICRRNLVLFLQNKINCAVYSKQTEEKSLTRLMAKCDKKIYARVKSAWKLQETIFFT